MLQDFGDSAIQSFAITKSDTVNQPFRRLWVGGTGNVAVVGTDGVVTVYTSVPAGVYLRVQGIRVNSTNTSATNMVGEN